MKKIKGVMGEYFERTTLTQTLLTFQIPLKELLQLGIFFYYQNFKKSLV